MVEVLIALLRERRIPATSWPDRASSIKVFAAMGLYYELLLDRCACCMLLDSQGGWMCSYNLASEDDLEALVRKLQDIRATLRGVYQTCRDKGVSS